MRDEEAVDHVELGGGVARPCDDDAVLDHELGHRDRAARPPPRAPARGAARPAARGAALAPRARRTGGYAQRAAPLGVRAGGLAHEGRRSSGPVLEPRGPVLELRGRRAARAGAPCRRRAARRPGRRRALRRARGSPRAAPGRPRARPPPGADRLRGRTNVAAVDAPVRTASSVTSTSGIPPGVETRSGRRVPSG